MSTVVFLGVWLLTLTVLGAALVVAHLYLLVATWQTESISRRDRWLALLPFVLPVVAYRAGNKTGTWVWGLLLACYIVLRVVA